MITFTELTASDADLDMLQRFYDSVYVPEFPDPDERESLDNMADYLRLKSRGWYGDNNYHILVASVGEQIIGGTISDFLAEANAGVLEFLVVAPRFRCDGIGSTLLASTETLLMGDARAALDREIDLIVGEINDPFRPSTIQDNLDPTKRTLIWHTWGYRGLDFPYVQPALSATQRPVSNLLLIAKLFRPQWQAVNATIPSDRIKILVHEYLRWAMRIQLPGQCPEFRSMADHLDANPQISAFGLDDYLGHAPDRPLLITSVSGAEQQEFSDLMRLYRLVFPPGPLSVDPHEFASALEDKAAVLPGTAYHLWSISSRETAPVEGLASFYSLPAAGFGGYLALTGSLQGSGRLRPLMRRMELQMLQDGSGQGAAGWFIESELIGADSPFVRLGFRELAIDYQQPRLTNGQVPVPTHLLYKPFGRCYGAPELATDEFLASIGQIFRVIYRIARPHADISFQRIERQLLNQGQRRLEFR